MASAYERRLAHIIYRASGRAAQPVEIHLIAEPEAATVADAWARLSDVDPSLDPRSLEIETRLVPGAARRAASHCDSMWRTRTDAPLVPGQRIGHDSGHEGQR